MQFKTIKNIIASLAKPKILIFIVMGILVVAGIFFYINTYIRNFFAANPVADTTFQPTRNSVHQGEQFTINLQLSGPVIAAGDIYIIYSPNVEYLKEAGQDTGFVQTSEYFDTPPFVEEVTTDTDGNKVLHVVLLSEKADSSAVSIGLLFRAKEVGTARFEIRNDSTLSGRGEGDNTASYIDFSEGTHITTVEIAEGTDDGDPSATPSPTPACLLPEGCSTPSPTPTPGSDEQPTNTPTPTDTESSETLGVNVKLNLKVKFQGILKQPADLYRELNVKVTLLSEDKEIKKEGEAKFTADGSGIWDGAKEFTDVPIDKSYNILIKGPKHLQKKICTANPKEDISGSYTCKVGQITLTEGENTLDFSNILNLAGDIPVQNGILDSADIIYIRQNFGNRDAEILKRADLNLDGIVDTQDYSMAIAALRFKYDE